MRLVDWEQFRTNEDRLAFRDLNTGEVLFPKEFYARFRQEFNKEKRGQLYHCNNGGTKNVRN